MHNCKATRDRITELLLDGATPSTEVLAELRGCNDCREEFETLNDTLRLTTRVMSSITPTEDYWTGYHAQLKRKLHANHRNLSSTPRPSLLQRVFATSIRVPVPIAAAVLLLFGVSLFFVSRAEPPKETQSNSIVRGPVEVPVVQEKIVTRVVYRDRYRTIVSRKPSPANSAVNDSTVAKSQKKDAAPSLVGFKPLDEIKLTVIKGGAANEK
jgi:hypothetical protein